MNGTGGQVGRRGLPRGLRRLLIASAVAHVLLIAGVVVAGKLAPAPPPPPPDAFIPTKLVKLGEKRAKHLLPRVNRPPPPKPKPDVKLAPAAAEAPTTSERPQPAMNALERAKSTSRVSSALDRLRRTAESTPEGDPEGVEDGEVTDLSMAIAGNKYATEIYRCIKRHYSIEGIDKQKVGDRQASVLVKIHPDGRLFDAKLAKRSGLAAFDRAVEKAVKGCGKVSKPPELLREAVGKDGIEIVFKP